MNSNYQYLENANDDFPNNVEYHDGYLNKDEPHRSYEQSNRQHANQILSNNLDVLSDENNYRKRRFDEHKVTYDNRYRQNAEISRQNFYETQYDVRQDNNPGNSSFFRATSINWDLCTFDHDATNRPLKEKLISILDETV